MPPRSRRGSGRTYTATYRLVDGSGNAVTDSATAFVPLNQGGKS